VVVRICEPAEPRPRLRILGVEDLDGAHERHEILGRVRLGVVEQRGVDRFRGGIRAVRPGRIPSARPPGSVRGGFARRRVRREFRIAVGIGGAAAGEFAEQRRCTDPSAL
jgi:hypothetical protein